MAGASRELAARVQLSAVPCVQPDVGGSGVGDAVRVEHTLDAAYRIEHVSEVAGVTHFECEA